MATLKLERGGLQDRFLKSRAKVQVYAGGYANGKTAAACVKAIEMAKDYPGSNGLIARSTYPKLNDTIRKEFIKWCPAHWIKSFPKSVNASNTCTLTNGTTINFRYIAQQGKSSGDATTSNLLSATYDWIVVDQMEDPEIVHKDFLDLLGRLRGMTVYDGDDPDMPKTGPRYIIMTCNPTRNWFYREVVKPIHDLKRGVFNDKLLCETDKRGLPILGDNKLPTPIVEVFEGSTYENERNLEPDFIRTLEATYKGQMRDRFLMGKWAAYEGLVYPTFDETVHVMPYDQVQRYHRRLVMDCDNLEYIEGYDYGMAVPFCYILGFVDTHGNIFLLDGLYKAEQTPEKQAEKIKEMRASYGVPKDNRVLADPSIFRRGAGTKKLVGRSIADMFLEDDIYCERGNANIANGIAKVGQYLYCQKNHQNPITQEWGAPYLYIADTLEFVINEFNEYYWKRTPTGDVQDVPTDRDDHAMDTVKYMLTHRPEISKLVAAATPKEVGWLKWGERDIHEMKRNVRYG